MSRWQEFDGQGAVCFDADGRVCLFVNDAIADLVAEAERRGMTADELVNRILDDEGAADVGLADGTGPVVRLEPPPWHPDFS